jgi:mono/diheme cytochrome c family protein
MKFHVLSLLVACLAWTGCAANKFKTLAPAPTPAMAEKSGQPLSTLEQGRVVFLAQCGRCHEHQFPDTVNSKDWHVVVPGMAWNAGISKSDEKAVLAYVLAAKVKK